MCSSDYPNGKPQPVSSPRANLGEGPVWDHRLGLLYWTNIISGTIHVHDPTSGQNQSFPTGAEMVGCFLTQTPGVLLLARESGFHRFDTRSGSLDLLANPIPNPTTHRFNDGKCDASGRLWIGTMCKQATPNAGAFYCVDRDFKATEVVIPITVPNGLAWSLDGKTFYHVDTAARAVRVYPSAAERPQLGRPKATIDLSSLAGYPDGLAIDREGKLWIAFWEGGCVHRIDPASGDCIATIDLPCRYVTSCAFGGPDFSDLYITTAGYQFTDDNFRREPLAGSLFRIATGTSGFPENLSPIA